MNFLNGLGGLAGPPVSLATKGQSSIQGFFASGFDVGFLGLLFLCGGFIIPPLHFVGYSGANLVAVGAQAMGLLKGAISAACTFAYKYVKLYYPSLWPLHLVLFFNPWFVFDIVQVLSPAFAEEGFKVPFFNKPLGGIGGTGKITPAVLGMIIASFSLGGFLLMDMIPKEVSGAAGPVLRNLFAVIGAVTALSGGGLTAAVALPQVMSAMRGVMNGPTAGGGEEAVAAAAAPREATGAITGGGRIKSSVPSLKDVADEILRNSAASTSQKGGAGTTTDTMSSAIFLGSLVVVGLGGLSYALAENKLSSLAS